MQGFFGSDDAVYAALSANGGVIGSMDRGKTWSRYDFNLSKLDVRAPTSSNGYLFACTGGGGVFRIETSADIYVPPIEYFPLYGATDIPTDLTFSWDPSEWARTYRIQIASDSLFYDIFAEDSSVLGTSIRVKGLRHNHSHFWRLWATGGFGSGLQINSRFTTELGAFGLSQNYPNLPYRPR